MTALAAALGLIALSVGIAGALSAMRGARDRAAVERARSRVEELAGQIAEIRLQLELELDQVREMLAIGSPAPGDLSETEVKETVERLWERIKAAERLTQSLAAGGEGSQLEGRGGNASEGYEVTHLGRRGRGGSLGDEFVKDLSRKRAPARKAHAKA